ncbi:hypothetical protein C7377_1810 [Balneicella halophila]|uniref:Peptidase n=1 Tax=Balneicella halophila TaxID=1537566 RepID=A0A7L4UMD7_BALHA|nr:M90 family metallopeptidase [Balneicella halophila]PVX49394.1 hypothetical protein C7377_1810 [Balneicella halophila]
MVSVFSMLLIAIFLILFLAIIYYLYIKKHREVKIQTGKPFPNQWRELLTETIEFYDDLDVQQKRLFEQRVHHFIATKKINGVDTEIDDEIRLMVASSAIIPMFAFPDYDYPNLQEVLIYPNGFNHEFNTEKSKDNKRNIAGMVGNRFMNGTMILSKPDLLRSYDLKNQKDNVGIHEFVHLVDKMDGAVDGVPEILIRNSFVAPWLELIKEKMKEIEKGKSDIPAYALKNNAEFLAVVSEYFFDAPEKFKKEHPKLYDYLSKMFKQTP